MSAYETRGQSDEWFTPQYIFDALDCRFDMDVAAPTGRTTNVPCNRTVNIQEDGLATNWAGFVWMNPPFGHQRHKRAWLDKFFAHGNGIALLPDRTSAPWWQEAVCRADAVRFLSPKVKFERPDGSIGNSPGTGTVLFANGPQGVLALKRADSLGALIYPQAVAG